MAAQRLQEARLELGSLYIISPMVSLHPLLLSVLFSLPWSEPWPAVFVSSTPFYIVFDNVLVRALEKGGTSLYSLEAAAADFGLTYSIDPWFLPILHQYYNIPLICRTEYLEHIVTLTRFVSLVSAIS